MMKSMKFFRFLLPAIIMLASVILVSGLIGAAPQNSKSGLSIGYIDSEKLQSELPDYKSLKEEIEGKKNELKQYQGFLYAKHKNDVKKLQDQASQEKNGKSAAEQEAIDKRLQENVQKNAEALNSQLEQKSSEMQRELREQSKAVEEKVRKIIADVAEDKKYSVVLEKNVVYYGGTDITQLVLDQAKKVKDSKKEDSSNKSK